MLDAVIFDVDGTLVDSVDFQAEAWSRAFAHFGWTVQPAQARAQIGRSGDQLLPMFLPEKVCRRDGEAIEAFRQDLFGRDYLPRVKGFPQVRALFERLIGDGKLVALASSAKRDELAAYKKAVGIADLALVQTSSDEANGSKPQSDIFLAALEKLKLPAKTCVVVSDTPHDAEAALKAGLRTTGVLCGGFPDFAIRSGGASQIFEDPADLLDHYKRWMADLG